jgi:hypothetical protein
VKSPSAVRTKERLVGWRGRSRRMTGTPGVGGDVSGGGARNSATIVLGN